MWLDTSPITVHAISALWLMAWLMGFNATFNNISAISWQSVLLVEETGVPGENHWPIANNWQTLSHNVVSSTPYHERDFELTTLVVIGTDCTGNNKYNYHMISTTMATPLIDCCLRKRKMGQWFLFYTKWAIFHTCHGKN